MVLKLEWPVCFQVDSCIPYDGICFDNYFADQEVKNHGSDDYQGTTV